MSTERSDRTNDLSSDPDAVMSAAGPAARRPVDVSTVSGDAAGHDAPPRSPVTPERMHRAEDDALARATSPEYRDRPDGATIDPPARPSEGEPAHTPSQATGELSGTTTPHRPRS